MFIWLHGDWRWRSGVCCIGQEADYIPVAMGKRTSSDTQASHIVTTTSEDFHGHDSSCHEERAMTTANITVYALKLYKEVYNKSPPRVTM